MKCTRAKVGTVLCSIGLAMAIVACGGGDPASIQNPDANVTLKLTQNQNGDLEYCDAQGNCRTLPYDGDCSTIEVGLNTATGRTCQVCVQRDGSREDQGCVDTEVACVVVTIPNPDCVVCAYVNGDVIFSTCEPDESECRTDADCSMRDGLSGRCLDGKCVFDQNCRTDADCPSGFHCEWLPCPMFCTPENGCVCDAAAICVPDEVECRTDADCPPGHVCLGFATASGGAGADDASSNASSIPDSAEDITGGGVCVPVPGDCQSDADCEAGYHCEMMMCPLAACPVDADCPPCYGMCVPDEVSCQSNADCPPGMECMQSCSDCRPGDPTCNVANELCKSVCVPAPWRCQTDADCATDNSLPARCEDGICIYGADCDTSTVTCDRLVQACPRGEVPSVVNGCWGPCVDPYVCQPMACDATQACPSGFACALLTSGATSDSGVPYPVQGMCVPALDGCIVGGCSGELCTDASAGPVASPCVWRPEYGCFIEGVCERQADGQCGWTRTPELLACMDARRQ